VPETDEVASLMAASKQLMIPNAALKDDKSYEIASVWVVGKAEHLSLLAGNGKTQQPGEWYWQI
jgi:hypothetical protein